jgi:hypothetical protein
VPEAPNAMASTDDLRRARSSLAEAELAQRPSDRYLAAHLTALRVVAIVLTHRAAPARTRPSSKPRNAWRMLAEVAPELAEWAAFFATTEAKRDAIRAGATAIVSAREADDLVRDVEAFLRLVERAVGFSAIRERTIDAAAATGP